MKPLFFSLLLLPLLFQCNRTAYTSADFPDDYLEFGQGGGYAGGVTTYFMLPNGQFFRNYGLKVDTTSMGQLEKKAAKNIFERFGALGLDTLQFNHPGNMYTFVKKHSQDTVLHLSWGNDPAPPAVLKTYYQELMDATKAFEVKPVQ